MSKTKTTICKELIKDYCANCSFAGIHYIADENKHVTERILWLVLVILSWYGSALLIISAFEAFLLSPISFGLETTYTDWETKMPSVAICEIANNHKIFNVSDTIWPPGHLLDLEDALKEIVYFRGVTYVLVGTCYLNPNPDPLCPKSNYSYYASLVRSDCTKIIKNCTYNDIEFPCCEYFQPIETDIGPCFILNSIQTKKPHPYPMVNNLQNLKGIIKFDAFLTTLMGRNKTIVRKRGGHSEDAMRKAMQLVQSGMSIRKASEECQLKYPTVRLYVNKFKINPEVRLTPNYEVNKIFTSEQEKQLLDYIEYCAQIFYGLSTKDCRRVAYQMAKVNNLKIPQSWIDSELAGFEWLRSFRKRHPEISLRKPEACSLARATAFNKHNIESFFRNLKSVMERHPSFADGTRVYNLDETSTTTVQRPGKILARKGTNAAKVTSGERGTLVTTCCIVSAIGQALPPAMVFPRKKFQPHMLHGAPSGTLGLAAASGWMNAEIFVDVMKHFIKHVSASKENPVLLIMDNHESHLSIEALDLAKSSGVTVLTLHPHTTAKLQPLDVGLNGPFKSYYNAAVDSWLLRHPGQPLTIYNVAECVGFAYMKSMTPINITNAFKKTGIFPFNDCIFTEVDFMPSTVTDRPQETDDQREKSSKSPSILENFGSTSRDNDITPPMIEVSDFRDLLLAHEDVDLQVNLSRNQDDDTTLPIIKAPELQDPLPVRENITPQQNLSINPGSIEVFHSPHLSRVLKEVGNQDIITHRIIEAAGPSKFISPQEFMPPIKAKPRDPKKRRIPGKSMIATDTPEKDAIAAKKIKVNKKEIKKAKQDLFTGGKTQNKTKKKNKRAIKERKIDIIESDDSSDENDYVASGSSSGGEEYISENIDEDEEGRIILNGNFLPLPRDPKEQEYVIVLFPYKKSSVYYVAKILETIIDDEDDSDFFVSFLRLKSRACQTFCEPLEPDTAGVQLKDIKYILPNPKITGSSRRQASYSFHVYFDLTYLNLR